MNDDTSSGLAWAGGILVAIILLVALIFGGQQLGFWLQNNSQNHQTTILKIQGRQFQAAPATQQGLLDDISNKYGQILTTTAEIQAMPAAQRPAWEAQRYQVTQEVCADAALLNSEIIQLPPSELQFLNLHCVGGAANPVQRYNY